MTKIPSKSAGLPKTSSDAGSHHHTDSRLLLRRMRDVMAGPGTGQERLNQIVKLIATTMVAEVCSLYLRRAGEVLELYATEGLKQSAVHHTRLRFGEGVIGDIAARARPLALAEAQAHPDFAYRPETGEEIYHSMLGVPILRGGKVIGVLAVQNRTRRHYTDEEVETLQTIAMVSAEMVAAEEFVHATELHETEGNALLPLRLTGVRLSGGAAIGLAVLHRPRPVVRTLIAEDVKLELERLSAALEGMYSALDTMIADSRAVIGGESREILETYRMIAEDQGWIRRIREAIEGGLTAEAAVQRVQDENNARMAKVQDAYLRERMTDFDDLANRLLQHLAEPAAPGGAPTQRELPEDAVVVAGALGPAELLDYDLRRLRAVVLEEGSPNCHVAIIARALDIPVVGRVRGVRDRVDALDTVIVDGDNAQVFLRPSEDVQAAFHESVAERTLQRAAFSALRDKPAVTLDGVRIKLQLNAGLLVDLHHLEAQGAEGIGLYRTEIPFMVHPNFPDVRTQTEIYAEILDKSDGRPVVFRTLDIGGDKILPYLADTNDDNPAMGWRALRIALDRPAILRMQLRAMIRAAKGRPLDVMFPMVAEVAEFDAARRIFDLELGRAVRLGEPAPATCRVGTMLEVPALLWQLPALAERVDFLSIGSNDLLQFLYASDRSNPRLMQRYDPLAPPVVALMRDIAATCAAARGGEGVPVTLCGEMAGEPLEAMALIGAGIRSLSMTASAIGPVKAMVRSLDAGMLNDYLLSLHGDVRRSLRDKLVAFARDHNIAI
jgi:phosphotransferase system enzyme I (PtsP)